MNNSQFASILIKAMPHYKPYGQEFGASDNDQHSYMCLILLYGIPESELSQKMRTAAENKIRKLIYPEKTLQHYLVGKYGHWKTGRSALAFWLIHIIKGKEKSKQLRVYYTRLLNIYIRNPDEHDWILIRKIYQKYIPQKTQKDIVK